MTLKEDIADLMDDLERMSLPYVVTHKLGALMRKHKIKRIPESRGISAG